MNSREAHKIWIEQCEAAETVRGRFGLKAAFDYLVREKLIHFAEAASRHRAFAHELPRFISEVRRMFTPEEVAAQLTRIEHERNEKNEDGLDEDILDEDDPLRESPAKIAERVRQFTTIKELLTATTLGTS
jgi:hypothetical protein